MAQRKGAQRAKAVLVADDHGVTRFGLMKFVKDKLSAQVAVEAERFDDALAILQRQQIDLALFDLDMPGITSPSELTRVRDRWPTTKVVVLSGSDDRGHILEALAAGVHGYIVKTETMDGLAERLGYVLSGEIYVPACLASGSSGRVSPRKPEATTIGSAKLTQRQRQVLEAIIAGKQNKQIAKDLDLAIGTVKMHVSAVFTALGAKNRLHAAAIGRQYLQ